MTFGKKLRSMREKAGLTQKELADAIGVGESTISFYESDKREPGKDVLLKLVNTLNVSLDYLYGRIDSPHLGDHGNAASTHEARPDVSVFASRLRAGLAAVSLTPEEASVECKVTLGYLQQLMTEPPSLPGISTLYKLAEMIGVTADYLAGYTDDPNGYSPHAPKPKDLLMILEREELLFNGVPLSDEDKQRIQGVMIGLFWEAKQMNKRKPSPAS
ncbi:helix-turn-helix domain-containing protein [Heliophilum fasciatum]|uniref:Transcriptional regulator with XRE-family HTH domain n=1 Tax=Heliophilum fasciatum TaxID=35700 RepID=A0A4R2RK92_9FIRM|nr:helix-turn-helix transcriptional regulator [Heliophilum fasciatum]MCW2278558.1 transcriptional regulator with XRE-family HTH domain [Heliophilum fasciatum]TCP63513.1 transcriptional regulator with XRE-family HTH domain [Heliophilum fasciatum]